MRHAARKKTRDQASLDVVDETVEDYDHEDRLRARIDAYWRGRGIDPHVRIETRRVHLTADDETETVIYVVRSSLVMRCPT